MPALALTLTLSERNALLWRPVNYNLAGTALSFQKPQTCDSHKYK